MARFASKTLVFGFIAIGLLRGGLVMGAQSEALTFDQVLLAALTANPDIKVRALDVDRAEGVVQQARGAFDAALNASWQRAIDKRPLVLSERASFPGLSEWSGQGMEYSLSVNKLTESGVVLGTSLADRYSSDALSDSLGLPAQTTRRIAFDVTVPLGRGSGDHYAKEILGASEHDLEATRDDRRYAVSAILRDVAIAYWEYLSRRRQLEIAQRGEERMTDLLQDMRRLVAADEIPSADLDLIVANQAERKDVRLAAEQSLLDARLALALKIGEMPPSATSQPGDEFPLAPKSAISSYQFLLERALASRSDGRALRLRIDAARARLRGAQDLVRPQVDLGVTVSSAGLREGDMLGKSVNPMGFANAGPSLAVQLNVKYPFSNNAAQGQMRQVAADLAEAEIRLSALLNSMTAGIRSAASEYSRAVASLESSKEIVERYAKALENERTKRSLGMATLIDVLNVEDRYFRALLDDVTRRRDYAVSLASLGHEFDLLVSSRGPGFEVSMENFRHPPQ